MQLLASEVSADYYTHPPGIVSLLMLTITYRQWPYIYIHRVGSTPSLYRIMVTAISAVGVMKMGNIVLRVGVEPTSLAFQASVLLLHHIGPLFWRVHILYVMYNTLCKYKNAEGNCD